MEKELFFDKYFDKIMVAIFIIIFLFSYSYVVGGYYYDIIPWIFFGGMLISLASVVGILMLPLALIYQTLFYSRISLDYRGL